MDLLNWALLLATAVYVGAAFAFTAGLFRLNKTASGAAARQEQPFVSVVIAVRNEADYIGGCLQGLVEQTYPAGRFEVLVVDDGSEDRTPEIVGRFQKEHPGIRLLSVGAAFPHMAAKKRPLSVGIRAARGEVILTTDADCRVPPTWIAGMAACFGPCVGVAIGFSQVRSACSRLTLFERLQGFDFLALMSASAGAAGLGVALAATGQNFAYRRALFHRAGGFEPIAGRPSGDDVLLLQLLRRAGGRAVFAAHPDAHVGTWRTESPSGFWQQRRRWASNAPAQFRLNRPFFVYIASVFTVNLLAPAGLAVGALSGAYLLPLACWAAKVLADLAVTWKGARTFGRRDLLPVLPLWELLQPPYVVMVGLAGAISRFTWKGRQYR